MKEIEEYYCCILLAITSLFWYLELQMESFSFTFTIFHPQNVVQIVYLPKHWLVVSTVGCSPGTVKVWQYPPCRGTKYFYTGYEKVLEKALATLLSNTYREITVNLSSAHNRMGGQLVAMPQPMRHHCQGTVLFDQAVMRDHLLHCFEAGKMHGFPQGSLGAQMLRRRQAPLRQEYLKFTERA